MGYQKLFDLMSEGYGLALFEPELEDIKVAARKGDEDYAALLESHQELLKIVKQVFLVGITPELNHVEKAIARAEGIG